MQVKLLRVLQERSVRPVGGTNEIAIDVRVIAATNRDLDRQVAENTFREDLYYRLSVIPVTVPSLRERREDIPLLVNHFLKKYAPAAGKSILRVNTGSLDALCGYDWPGNVRQLENTIERAVSQPLQEVSCLMELTWRSMSQISNDPCYKLPWPNPMVCKPGPQTC